MEVMAVIYLAPFSDCSWSGWANKGHSCRFFMTCFGERRGGQIDCVCQQMQLGEKEKPLEGLCNLKVQDKWCSCFFFFKEQENGEWNSIKGKLKKNCLKVKLFSPSRQLGREMSKTEQRKAGSSSERKQRPISENILHHQIIWSALSLGVGENVV